MSIQILFQYGCSALFRMFFVSLGHFQVLSLFSKTRLSAKPLENEFYFHKYEKSNLYQLRALSLSLKLVLRSLGKGRIVLKR